MNMLPLINSTDGLTLGKKIHKSNENVCHLGTWKGHPEAGEIVIKKLIISRAESLNKFDEEVDFLSLDELKHAIVRPLAVVRDPPHYSILLPYMQKGSLDKVIHDDALPLGFELSLILAIDCARSLATVHNAGFIHRDIKAANFLVNNELKVLLSDFGSARYTDEAIAKQKKEGREVHTAPTGGFHKEIMDGTTLLYTAPEVLHNHPATQKSDIYSLAITLAEIATGYMPYNTVEKAEADMHTVLDASYSKQGLRVAIVNNHLRPPLRVHRHDIVLKEQMQVPEEFNAIIEKCWAPKPEDRPTAQQCFESLVALAQKHNIDFEKPRNELLKQAEERLEQVRNAADAMQIEQTPVAPPRNNGDTIQMDVDVATPSGLVQQGGPLRGTGLGALERNGENIEVNESLKIGAFATSGRRGADKMEDRHAVSHSTIPSGVVTVCQVFDGHGGALCADYCAKRLPNLVASAIANNLENPSARAQTTQAHFVALDEEFRSTYPANVSGATAISVAIWDTASGTRQGMIANLGDCRAVLCKRNRATGELKTVRLSRDQNADNADECARIQAAGGKIIKTADGRNRVQGHIQVTRSLGDAKMKPFGVFAQPEVQEFTLDDSCDEFIVVATDGIWDVMSDEQVAVAVLSTAREPGLAAKRIGADALTKGSNDNISSIVVFLRDLSKDASLYKSSN